MNVRSSANEFTLSQVNHAIDNAVGNLHQEQRGELPKTLKPRVVSGSPSIGSAASVETSQKATSAHQGKGSVGRLNYRHSGGKNRIIVRGTGQIPTVSIGATETTFAAVARRTYFYVGNVNPQTEKEEVVRYLKSKIPHGEFILDALPMRENAFSRAFKLTTDFALFDMINKAEFWPQGVVVKNFFRFERKPRDRGQQ